ncbi:MAG: site-2 protease family protein [Burkholderiaceae bacterium]|nr:site-2 protease family protein [Burkholderiaceae bacterium]
MPDDLIQTIALYALPVLFAITAHEAAHALVAKKLGDNTAAMLGRVTFNPIKHIDPVGTIAIPLILALVTHGAFVFGYAKPVPVRFDRLKNPRRDMIWVALAGPVCNLVQALIWRVLFYLLLGIGIHEPFFLAMCRGGVMVNVVMFAFNLFPLPPLDGGRVLVGLLPAGPSMALARLERWGFFIVMLLVMSRVINPIWMNPIMQIAFTAINLIVYPLRALIF